MRIATGVIVLLLHSTGCSRDDKPAATPAGAAPPVVPQRAEEPPESEIARLTRSFAAYQPTAEHRRARERLALLLPGRLESLRAVTAEFEEKAKSGDLPASDVLDNVCDVIQLSEVAEGASLAVAWTRLPQQHLRLKAVQTVGSMPSPTGSEALVERALDANEAPSVRTAALEGLGRVGDPSIAPLLRPLLADESSPDLLTRAVAALGFLGDKASADRFFALATTVDSPVALESMRALVRVGDPRGIEKIEPLASSGDAHFRLQAASLLSSAPTIESCTRLAAMAGDAEAAVRQTVVGGLAMAPPRFDADATFRKLASDSDSGVRRGALFAAGQAGAAWALEVLRTSAADPKSGDRIASMVSLGRCRDRESVPPFLVAAGDIKETPRIRLTASNNLARIGDPSSLPPLIAIAAEAEGSLENGEPLWRAMSVGLANFAAEAIGPAAAFYKASKGQRGRRVAILVLSFIGGRNADAARRALLDLLAIESDPALRGEIEAALAR